MNVNRVHLTTGEENVPARGIAGGLAGLNVEPETWLARAAMQIARIWDFMAVHSRKGPRKEDGTVALWPDGSV